MKLLKKMRMRQAISELADHYEKRLKKLYCFERYQNAGKLLLSSVVPGEEVFLIAKTMCITDLFDRVHECLVTNVEFIGKNNAIIHLLSRDTGIKYTVRNCEFGKIFFLDYTSACQRMRRQQSVAKRR